MEKSRIQRAYDALKTYDLETPEILIVLGSGLGFYADSFEDKTTIPYSDIDGFPLPTVEGHSGNLIFGKKHGKNIVVMQGRFHCYEGYCASEVVIPLRALIKLGIKSAIFTNAAGGVNEDYKVGDVMIIKDHINIPGLNPLVGKNLEDFGERFVDMTFAYDADMVESLYNHAKELGISVHKGVYCIWTGPSFETPAEIVMTRTIGGDAVGMSTVPEVIACAHAKIKCAAISSITNMAAGMKNVALNHEEVLQAASTHNKNVQRVLDAFLSN